MKHLYAILFICSINSASAQDCLETVYSGNVTFYQPASLGWCSYPTDTPARMAALNTAQFDSSYPCGACILVTSAKGSVMLHVADHCAGCGVNSIDVSEDADTFLTDVQGIIPVQWKMMGCPVTGNIQLYFGMGTNPYYMLLQPRNHRYPVRKMEFKYMGQYVALPKKQDNFYEATGFGQMLPPFDFRLTDYLGNVIEETGVTFGIDTVVDGTHQFPVCVPSSVNVVDEVSGVELLGNPARNGEFILLNKNNSEVAYLITDVTGRIVTESKLPANQQRVVHLPAKGMYLVQFPASHDMKGYKVVVE